MSTCHRRKAGRKRCRVGSGRRVLQHHATSRDIMRSGAGGVRCHSTEGVAEESRGGGSGRQAGVGSGRGFPLQSKTEKASARGGSFKLTGYNPGEVHIKYKGKNGEVPILDGIEGNEKQYSDCEYARMASTTEHGSQTDKWLRERRNSQGRRRRHQGRMRLQHAQQIRFMSVEVSVF